MQPNSSLFEMIDMQSQNICLHFVDYEFSARFKKNINKCEKQK